MFQPARPLLIWSMEANCRARLKGSEKLLDAVAIRPMRSVTAAIAGSSVTGSSQMRAPRAASSVCANMSAKKIESNRPASARCASAW